MVRTGEKRGHGQREMIKDILDHLQKVQKIKCKHKCKEEEPAVLDLKKLLN